MWSVCKDYSIEKRIVVWIHHISKLSVLLFKLPSINWNHSFLASKKNHTSKIDIYDKTFTLLFFKKQETKIVVWKSFFGFSDFGIFEQSQKSKKYISLIETVLIHRILWNDLNISSHSFLKKKKALIEI